MKIFYILSLWSVSVFSQTILYQPETSSRTVQDPQAIILAPGFYAKADTSNPFIAKIGPATQNSGGGPIDSDAGSGNPSGTTAPSGQSFHDTKGNIEVNGSGQLQFTLPIALPPGVKSVAPQISLVYSSGSGNGIAGYGWNLSGITSISRTGKNIEKDGEVKAVQLDYSDYYMFNGQRLILKSGEYGKDGAEYVTEKYSNVKIKSVGSVSAVQPWQGPEYWEVTFEDGSQAWYGGTASGNSSARTPIEYNIVKWRDAQGNYITYNYSQSGNVSSISSIQWGGNESLGKVHFNEIIFNYQERKLIETSYLNEHLFVQKQLLNNIVVNTNNALFKKYEIKYAETANGYQFVDTLTEYNAENIKSNPVVFGYKENAASHIEERGSINYSKFITFGDFDGNGILDGIYKRDPGKLCLEWAGSSDCDECYTYCTNEVNTIGGYYLKLNNLKDAYNTTNEYYLGDDSSFEKIKTLKYKNSTGNLEQGEFLYIYKEETNSQTNKKNLVFYYYKLDLSKKVTDYTSNQSALILMEKKVYDGSSIFINDVHYYDPNTSSVQEYTDTETTLGKSYEMDIDGDGLSELIIEKNYKKTRYNMVMEGEYSPYIYYYVSTLLENKDSYLIVQPYLNSNLPSEITFPDGKKISEKAKWFDFDGDGIIDIGVKGNTLPSKSFSYTQNDENGYPQNVTGNIPVNEFLIYGIRKILNGNFEFYLKRADKLSGHFEDGQFGDFNGDGLVDWITYASENIDNYWVFSLNTGKGFNEQIRNDLVLKKNFTYKTNTFYIQQKFKVLDINNDGKSDLISLYYNTGITGNNEKYSKVEMNISYNLGEKNGMMQFGNYEYFTKRFSSLLFFDELSENIKFDFERNSLYIIANGENASNYGTSIVLFSKDNIRNNAVVSISQGGKGTDIDYKELDPDTSPGSYAPIKKEQYPYMELDRLSQTYAVSQLRQEGRKQDFRFRGMISHLQGRGVIGFRQSAKSSWYADGFENTKIWSGAETDPLNDGLPIKEWSVRTNNENLIFPADLSENNSQLISFKSTVYQTDQLLGGQLVTSVASTDKPKVVKAILPKNTRVKDFLTGRITESSITYGNYYLPTQTLSTINDGYAATTSTFEYVHNPSGTGAGYYIGRPKSKTDVVQAYSDTKSAKEEYTYENNLLKTQKNWNRDNTGSLQTTYNYDGFGNITQKTTGNSVDSQTQTTKAEYDGKGRFVVKKTDNLGLETNITYNDWGQVTKQTDPLGNTLENEYDGWGKLMKSKTNLEGTTSYQYERDNNSNITVTQYDSDGDISKKYANKLGQEYKVSSKALGQEKYISKETQYDILGRKLKESEAYFEGQAANGWNTITYDDSVFPAKITATAFNGKQMETSISGNITTVKELNGYGRTTSKTTDALGNVISTTDKGGSIQFSYNAAGEQTKAQYAGNTVTTAYDAWGRKSEFNDPSNGIYKYEYDGFGQPKKIISPKGAKEYIYNNLGQLISQKELSRADGGKVTSKLISFTYDDKGRLISKSGTSKGESFSSSVAYDPQGRLLSSSESSNGKYFIQKGITYDDKARVVYYEKQLYSSGVLTKVQIENVYSTWNGELYQIKDKITGKSLWQLKEANAKGQVLKAKLGAVDISNVYDNNGFLTNVNHSSAVKPSILQLSYSFDAIKNELKSRTTGGDFNITESFDYDDNNRLVNWTNPVTGVKPSANRNVYDVKGRILENDQVGKIKFENAAKIYQPTGMTLNATGTPNYTNDLIQSISYNENNDPVFIDGENGDVVFRYGLTAMRQRVTYGGNFSADGEGKFTKFYSEDGSYEIVKDNTTGKEKHIIYIGGSPYESNIVYLKNYTESSGSYKFLHKDYLGSILAISDEAGNKLEQRHFDAWGNLIHLQIGNGPVITDKNGILNEAKNLILDRGYTSHEHFMEIGIIHMNGRLYDPLLRRFLNTDENIQDPYNTQNYNKYGYVLNNPLMYNDPSGELLWFIAPMWALIHTFLTAAITAAFWGAVIGAGLYLIKAAITDKFSMGGFAKAILLGGLSGFVTGGVSSLFSVGSFAGTVGVGALTGGLGGGIDAAFNGTNFLEGVLRGAAFGGTVAAVSWTITKMVNAANITKGNHEYNKTDSYSYNNIDRSIDQEKYSYGTIKKFEESYGSLGNEGVEHYYLFAPDGYGIAQDDSFYKKTWWDNLWNNNRIVARGQYLGIASKNNIYLSKAAFASKGLFTEVITHETGHVILNTSNLAILANTATNFSKYADNEFLDNWGHVAIRRMSIELQKVNPWMNVEWINSAFKSSELMRYINSSKPELDILLKKLIKPFKY